MRSLSSPCPSCGRSESVHCCVFFFQELLKYTDKSHPDYDHVVAAQQAMKEVAMHINEQKRRMENIGKIGRWQLSIDGWKVCLYLLPLIYWQSLKLIGFLIFDNGCESYTACTFKFAYRYVKIYTVETSIRNNCRNILPITILLCVYLQLTLDYIIHWYIQLTLTFSLLIIGPRYFGEKYGVDT